MIHWLSFTQGLKYPTAKAGRVSFIGRFPLTLGSLVKVPVYDYRELLIEDSQRKGQPLNKGHS